MIVRGASKTITYQGFEAQVSTAEDQSKTLVFIEIPSGVAHAFPLADEGRDRIRDELAPVGPRPTILTPSAGDMDALRKEQQQ